jgi:serine/threonine-protein kinase RsbW
MNPSTRKIRLNILSDPANLAGARVAIERMCAEHGFEPKACDEIGLCVNEAMANIIRHAYAGARDRPIELLAEIRDDAVRIEIRDWGNGVNPLSRPRPRPDPLRPGGLGLVCLRQMMHELEFVPQPDGMLLRMTRKK